MLANLMEGKMSMQKVAAEKYKEKIFEELKELEEQKTREALELVQRKHKLVTWEGGRERARMPQRMELSGAVGHCSGAFSFGSCSSSLAHDTEEALSASSWVAQVAEDATSESSWTALGKTLVEH